MQIMENGHNGCLITDLTPNEHGYVRTSPSPFRSAYVHRMVYEAMYGEVPEGLELDHLCRNPECINPEHLEAVTHAENMRRGIPRVGAEFCRKGHSDFMRGADGQRRCRPCFLNYNRTYNKGRS